jgi:APA family basic amino acid/polyamine antiporter
VFLLPAALAPFGGTSVLAWLVSAAGSLAFGLVIARLARRHPDVGGPYAYTRRAFGEFAAFLVGWGYWISCWCAQAAIAVAMVGLSICSSQAPARETKASLIAARTSRPRAATSRKAKR